MKRLSKSLFLFFTLLVLTLIPVQSTMAASARPGNVSKLTAKAASVTICGYGLNLASPINWGAIAMILDLIEVPIVSLISGAGKAEKKNEKLFECFSNND